MASKVSVDLSGFSVSYNEYFRYYYAKMQNRIYIWRKSPDSSQSSGEQSLTRKVCSRYSGYLTLMTPVLLRRMPSGRLCKASRASQMKTLRRWLRVRLNRIRSQSGLTWVSLGSHLGLTWVSFGSGLTQVSLRSHSETNKISGRQREEGHGVVHHMFRENQSYLLHH